MNTNTYTSVLCKLEEQHRSCSKRLVTERKPLRSLAAARLDGSKGESRDPLVEGIEHL